MAKNLIGLKFGHLTVISSGYPKIYGKRKLPAWLCNCDCGTENHHVVAQNLISGAVKSCGCTKGHKDLTGKRFGKLIVIGLHGRKNRQLVWSTDCDCGTKNYLILASGLYNGTKSCGCISKEVEDLIGKKFNKLYVIKRIENKPTTTFECQCDCGTIKLIRASHLKSGAVKSCGCLSSENIEKIHKSKIKNCISSLEERLYRTYQRGARKRNISFFLTLNEFKILIHKHCFYCLSEPIGKTKTRRIKYKNIEMKYNGIDRINNLGPYSLDNCVTCCKYCNRCKYDMTVDDFKQYIKKIYNNLIKE